MIKSWQYKWQVEKWSEEACEFTRRRLVLPKFAPVSSAALREIVGMPEELVVIEDNLLVNVGIQRLLDLLVGAGGTVYNAANAYLGVGDSAIAEASTQSDLQAGANRLFKAMNATFPSRINQTTSWQADFATTEANFHWQEWGVTAGATGVNGAGFNTPTTLLNRKTGDFGTKATGTWTFTGSLTLS